MVSTFPSFPLEQSELVKTQFYPGKIVRKLRFAVALPGIDFKKANQYLLEQSSSEDRIALFGIPNDAAYTTAMMQHPRVSALKMYYSCVDPYAKSIYEFFKPEILSEAEKCQLPIILHLPRLVTNSMEDIRKMIRDFPNLRIVFAHLGPTDFLYPGLEDAFGELAQFSNVYLDTSLNNSRGVIELALRIFGSSKIMYGSDEPLHLIRGQIYVHPTKGNRLITEYPYHWVDLQDHQQYSHLSTGVVHWHWSSLVALREAIDVFPSDQQEAVKRMVFFGNAFQLFGF